LVLSCACRDRPDCDSEVILKRLSKIREAAREKTETLAEATASLIITDRRLQMNLIDHFNEFPNQMSEAFESALADVSNVREYMLLGAAEFVDDRISETIVAAGESNAEVKEREEKVEKAFDELMKMPHNKSCWDAVDGLRNAARDYGLAYAESCYFAGLRDGLAFPQAFARLLAKGKF
jgi:hypothetical protein